MEAQLCSAAHTGHQRLVRALLSQGVNVNTKNSEGNTPLHLAVQTGNYDDEIVKMLIDAGADVHLRNNKGETPLDLHFKTDWYITGLCSVLKKLIQAGSDINYCDSRQNTALHLATNLLSDDCERFLINRGANINARDINGRTPLHLLAKLSWNLQNHTEIQYWLSRIKFFLKNGADIDARDSKNATPLMKIVDKVISTKRWGKSAIEGFLKLNPDVNILTQEGHNILTIREFHLLPNYPAFIWQTLIEHIAKMIMLRQPVHDDIMNTIKENRNYTFHFKSSYKELKMSQEKLLQGSQVSYYNLMVDSKKKLFKYAEKKSLVVAFNKCKFSTEFPIYGGTIKKRFSKVIKTKKMREKSAVVLSGCLPFNLNPQHLALKKIVSSFKIRDMVNLVGNV